MEEAILRCRVFAADKSGDPLLLVTMRNGQLTMRGDGLSGWQREVLEIVYKGPPIEFAIDPDLLIRMANQHPDVLVTKKTMKAIGADWDCPSKTMNPTLPQSEIDAAFAEDPAAARSEFGGEWRDDVSAFIERSLVESLVARGRKELMPRLIAPNVRSYSGFVDLSGGRHDDAALAIGHKENRKVILDFAKVWHSPFNPHVVTGQMAEELKRFGLRRCTGDNYAAEFVAEAFKSQGFSYTKSELPKAELYRELLPRLCSAEIELLDSEQLVDQLAGLERRTRSGGKDVIDHPPGGKDDLANAVAGVSACLAKPQTIVGGWPVGASE